MTQCNVCLRTSFFPKRFGKANICSACYLKIKGPSWNHQYEQYQRAELKREKAISLAQKYEYPEFVVAEINNFFLSQQNLMQRCDCCNNLVRSPVSIGTAILCNQCFDKINTSAWKEEEYESNDEVEKNLSKVLKTAQKNQFPPNVIAEIHHHFDSKIQPGLLISINSGLGQKLKVYETYSILTTQTSFNDTEILKLYRKVSKDSDLSFKDISSSLVENALKRDVIGSVMTSAVGITAVADAISAKKRTFEVFYGDYHIDYSYYKNIEYHKADDSIGFIRFSKNPNGKDCSGDVVFFFADDSRKVNFAYKSIMQKITSMSKN